MVKPHGWKGFYGYDAEAAQDRVNVDDYAPTKKAWLESERTRMREVMRNKRKKDAEARDGFPDYPEPVLNFIEGWVAANKSEGRDIELTEAVYILRKAARLAGVAGYDAIQDRGVAKYLRRVGFTLKRRNSGMVVLGLTG